MTKKEKILISNLLDWASDVFSNHGCNDVPMQWYAEWTNDEIMELIKNVKKWNGDDEWPEYVVQIGDSSLMAYYRDLLRSDEHV